MFLNDKLYLWRFNKKRLAGMEMIQGGKQTPWEWVVERGIKHAFFSTLLVKLQSSPKNELSRLFSVVLKTSTKHLCVLKLNQLWQDWKRKDLSFSLASAVLSYYDCANFLSLCFFFICFWHPVKKSTWRKCLREEGCKSPEEKEATCFQCSPTVSVVSLSSDWWLLFHLNAALFA